MTAAAATLAELQARLAALGEDLAARYGEDLSRLEAASEAGRLVVRGSVVVPRQLDLLRQKLRDWPAEAGPVELEVVVLAGGGADSGWLGHPGAGRRAIWSRRSGGKLVTEWLPGDGPARLLIDGNPRALVELGDATVGWVERTALAQVSAPERPVAVFGPGETAAVGAERAGHLGAAARAAASRNVPYRLGGRSFDTGLDCSAFVQLLFREHAGVLLPRHSGDQMQVGQRVGRGDIEVGDLVFVRTLEKNHLHVGIVVEPGVVVHACRLDGRVKQESLGEFLTRYRYLRAQRVLVMG